jgi:hypothetical protein
MPQLLYPPAGPQSIGQVLDTGFRIFQLSLVRCLLYGVAGMIAGQLPNIYSLFAIKSLGRVDWRDPVWIGLYGVSLLVSLLIYAALVVRQHGMVMGHRRGLRTELAAAFRRLPAILGVALIGIAAGGLGVLLAVVASGTLSLNTGARVVALILAVVVVLPVVYFSVPFSFTTPALMLDGKGALQSVRYSLGLISGCWWRTGVIYSIAGVIVVTAYFVATIASVVALSVIVGADVVVMSASATVVIVALGALALPFASATVLATYGELKVRREAVDLETRLAEVART